MATKNKLVSFAVAKQMYDNIVSKVAATAANGSAVRRVLPAGNVDVTDTTYALCVAPACNII